MERGGRWQRTERKRGRDAGSPRLCERSGRSLSIQDPGISPSPRVGELFSTLLLAALAPPNSDVLLERRKRDVVNERERERERDTRLALQFLSLCNFYDSRSDFHWSSRIAFLSLSLSVARFSAVPLFFLLSSPLPESSRFPLFSHCLASRYSLHTRLVNSCFFIGAKCLAKPLISAISPTACYAKRRRAANGQQYSVEETRLMNFRRVKSIPASRNNVIQHTVTD